MTTDGNEAPVVRVDIVHTESGRRTFLNGEVIEDVDSYKVIEILECAGLNVEADEHDDFDYEYPFVTGNEDIWEEIDEL